ncbi:acyl-CoA dehydrogenase family protein [Patulibacter sp. NPDC049589]|uniref:acyl-CoA dehydrogenase family protein n=1 Tax=Patulibacter sp. NPDC049589 TaxID=3154731 RepID=UPI003447FA8A
MSSSATNVVPADVTGPDPAATSVVPADVTSASAAAQDVVRPAGAGETRTRSAAPLPAGDPAAVLRAADLVAARIAPHAAEHDRTGVFAPDNVDALWDAGLGALTLPAVLGGTGASLSTATEAVSRVAAADPATALVWVMHLLQLQLLGAPETAADWDPALRDELVADVLAGPALVNALRVEPDLGTPARGGVPATRAHRTTDAAGAVAWRVSGHKTFVTGSVGLRWLAVWAAAEDADGAPLAGPVLIRADSPGVEIRETWDHVGLRASASHDVLLHDVLVPGHHAVGLAAPGADSPVRRGALAAWATGLLTAVYVGVGRSALADLATHLRERVPSNLGAPLSTVPRLQAETGEVRAQLLVAETLVSDLARDADRGGAHADAAAERAGLVKTLATRAVVEAARRAAGAVGNAGLTLHHPLQRHLRDALCGPVHTPQDDTVLRQAGRTVLEAAPPAAPSIPVADRVATVDRPGSDRAAATPGSGVPRPSGGTADTARDRAGPGTQCPRAAPS